MTTEAIPYGNRRARRSANKRLGGHDLRGVVGPTEALVCLKCWRMDLLSAFIAVRCDA